MYASAPHENSALPVYHPNTGEMRLLGVFPQRSNCTKGCVLSLLQYCALPRLQVNVCVHWLWCLVLVSLLSHPCRLKSFDASLFLSSAVSDIGLKAGSWETKVLFATPTNYSAVFNQSLLDRHFPGGLDSTDSHLR